MVDQTCVRPQTISGFHPALRLSGRNFVARSTKLHMRVDVSGGSSSSTAEEADDSMGGSDDDGLVWYQLTAPIRGFKG